MLVDSVLPASCGPSSQQPDELAATTLILRSQSSQFPILDTQAGTPIELSGVGRNERDPARAADRGDLQIVRPDNLASRLEIMPDVGVVP